MLKEIRRLDFCMGDVNKTINKLLDEMRSKDSKGEEEDKISDVVGRLVMARKYLYKASKKLKDIYDKDNAGEG